MSFKLRSRHGNEAEGFAYEPQRFAVSGGGSIELASNTVNTSGQVVWSTDSGFIADRLFTLASSGTSAITNVSGQVVSFQAPSEPVYRRSDDPLTSLPNIWCKKCYHGLLESLQHGYMSTYQDKIWATCFECWRMNHERN